jgi:hypothetical protein
MGIASPVHKPLGTRGLWGVPGLKLPAGIQHLAHALIRERGVDRSKAIQMAIGIMRNWAAGKGDVTPKTRAAAIKALAELAAAQARARATPNKGVRTARRPAGTLVQLRRVPTAERQRLAVKGQALPGGGFPVKTEQDVRNALQAWGRSKPADRPALKRLLLRAARRLKLMSLMQRIQALTV